MTEAAMAVRTAGSLTGLELHVGEPARGFVREYLDGARPLGSLYTAHPRDAGAFIARADAVQRRLSPELRARVAAAYRPTTPAAAERLDRILAGEGVMVTTGQQPGLFGGPLYTVYKILSAVRLAECLEPVLGMPVMAAFWIGNHDHDWAEVNHTHVVGSTSDLHRLELAGEAEPPVAMYARVLGEAALEAVSAMKAMLPASEFATDVNRLLDEAYRPERTMGAAFADLLHGLLRDFDLAFFDPAHASAWPAAAPVIARELGATAQHAALLARQTERLERAGYPAQVTIAHDAANVFLHDENGRDRLMREEGQWVLRRTKRTLDDKELTALLEAEPERFSPNVLLRPVVESSLIPTIAYVGGPAETTYFAQIGCLFRAHGMDMPIIVPRRNVTVVEGRVRKVLDKFGLEPAVFARPFHEVSTQVIHGELPASVTESISALRATIDSRYESLIAGAAAVDPTLHGWMTSNRNSILSQLDAAEKKVTSHLKKRSEVEMEQLRKAAVNLYPEGVPQERSLGPLPYIARYGPGFLRDVASKFRYDFSGPVEGWAGLDCD